MRFVISSTVWPVIALVLLSGCTDLLGTEDAPSSPTSPQQMWGTWIRIDTGAEVYISDTYVNTGSYEYTKEDITSASGTTIVADDITYRLESANVIDAGDYKLYKKGGSRRSFSVRVAGFSDSLYYNRIAGSAIGTGIGDIPVNRGNPDNPSDTETTTTDGTGTATFTDGTAGDEHEIHVDYRTPSGGGSITVPVEPTYDGEFLGTVPLVEDGYNFKTSYSVDETDNGFLFGDEYKTYNVTIVVQNIGNADARTSYWEITLPEGLSTTGSLSGNFSTIAPDENKEIELPISAREIDGEYEDFEIKIEVTGSDSLRTWEDWVSLRFYRLPILVKTYAYNQDERWESLKSFLISPDGRSFFFETSHKSARSMIVPYMYGGYTLVQSGAGYDGEMKYSFAVGGPPTIVGPETWSIGQINRYDNYDSEDSAYPVSSPTDAIDGYLSVGEYAYFDIDISELSDGVADPIRFVSYDLYDPDDRLPEPGDTMRLDVQIMNATAFVVEEPISATLTTTSSYITITDNVVEYYYDLDPGEYASIYNQYGSSSPCTTRASSCSSYFEFSIAAETPPGTVIPFQLRFTDNEGNTNDDGFTITVE